jgi:CPA2 family monovalent cation:H+ antiporter-2
MHAAQLIITTSDVIKVRQMIQTARTLNPAIAILISADNEAEAKLLRTEANVDVFVPADEMARGISDHALVWWQRQQV